MRRALSLMGLLVVAAVGTSADAPKPSYPALPEAFSSFGAAVSDGHVYVYGGHTGKAHTYSTDTVSGKFRRLKLAEPKSWEELPGGDGLQGLALVAHGGKLYRIGGMQPRNKAGDPADNHSTATCTVFDPKTSKWEKLPDMPAGRSSHDAVVVGDQIIVVGGWNLQGVNAKSVWHDTTLLLDLTKKPLKWEAVAQPFERRALNVGTIDGKVYVVCGMSSENETEKTVDIFDPVKKTWSRGPSLPGSIRNGFTPAVCTAGDRLYASPADGKLYRLTEKKDGWEEAGALEKSRVVHRIVPARDDLILVLGGAGKASNVADTEAIEPACCGKGVVAKAPVSPDESGQVYCPIMAQVVIEASSPTVEYQGVTIRLCCRTCVKKWNADPDAYAVANLALLPQLKGKELPKRTIAQTYCPVYPDRVVSSKDPSAEYQGKTIYFFSESAKKRFLADPVRYADPKVLPQLSAAK